MRSALRARCYARVTWCVGGYAVAPRCGADGCELVSLPRHVGPSSRLRASGSAAPASRPTRRPCADSCTPVHAETAAHGDGAPAVAWQLVERGADHFVPRDGAVPVCRPRRPPRRVEGERHSQGPPVLAGWRTLRSHAESSTAHRLGGVVTAHPYPMRGRRADWTDQPRAREACALHRAPPCAGCHLSEPRRVQGDSVHRVALRGERSPRRGPSPRCAQAASAGNPPTSAAGARRTSAPTATRHLPTEATGEAVERVDVEPQSAGPASARRQRRPPACVAHDDRGRAASRAQPSRGAGTPRPRHGLGVGPTCPVLVGDGARAGDEQRIHGVTSSCIAETACAYAARWSTFRPSVVVPHQRRA